MLNYLLIYDTRSWYGGLTMPGAGLGVGGAALASALSLTLSGVLVLRTVFWNRRRPVSLCPEEGYRPDGR